MATDLRSLDRNDQGVLAAGVLAFIFSLIDVYYGGSVSFAGFHASRNVNAWHFGWNVLAMLLILAATLVAAAQLFAKESIPETPVSLNFIVAGLSGLGTLILIIRSFTTDSASGGGASVGLRWGAYVLMILCIVQVAFAVMRLRASGEAMPWENRAATPPAAPPVA